MTENPSTAADPITGVDEHAALADTGRGHWETDPEDPEFEVWVVDPPRTTPEAAAKWDAMLEENDSARCVAHKKTGERCRRLAIKGATVCRVHGGASGHVRRAARARLEMAADRMAKELLKIAVSDEAPDHVKLAAIKDALDRAGLSAKTAVEVSVDPKPFEGILEAVMSGGSRAESRARRGDTAKDRAPDAAPDWIDAELVEVQHHDDTPTITPRLTPRHHDEPRPVAGEGSSAETGMLDLADALDQLHGHTPPRKGQR
ncbi:hypothetical protein ACK8HH_03630 [Gordonia sp. LUNF6]|uniref:hypothetical protein n=1 Tax=Gordonia sp. LUNF6 TaxID=3388658 RepID=UPI0039999D1A